MHPIDAQAAEEAAHIVRNDQIFMDTIRLRGVTEDIDVEMALRRNGIEPQNREWVSLVHETILNL